MRGDVQIIELLRSSVESNVDTVFRALQHDISLENIEPPTAALEYARRIAQRGVPMNALIRAYRLGHGLILDAAAEEINGSGVDARTALVVFEHMTAMTFRYIDWITQQVVEVYEEERDRWLSNRNSARALRVREVLSGNESDEDAVTAAIQYPMHRRHLAAVLWWPTPVTREGALAELERLLRAIAGHLDTQGDPLFLAADQLSAWGWLPLSAATAPHAVERIRQFMTDEPDPPAIALGAVSAGLDGFRRSHQQANRAHGLATAAGHHGVTAIGTPGLEAAALMGENLDSAREFVHATLGPLAGAGAADARLRETLRVFLHHNSSYTAAADELVVHFNTVKYRVGRALERRGRPLDDGRLDVEIALLLCHWYGTAVLP